MKYFLCFSLTSLIFSLTFSVNLSAWSWSDPAKTTNKKNSIQIQDETHRPYTNEELSYLRKNLPIGQLHSDPVHGEFSLLSSKCQQNTWTLSLTDPLDGSEWLLQANLFLPTDATASNKVPAMLMMPPISGTFFLDYQIAINLCNQHIAVISFDPIRPENRKSDDLSLDRYDQTLIRALTPAHWAFEILSNLAVVDSSKIGAMGMSLGGIIASFYSAYETRIQTLIHVVAGDYLPGILTHTQQRLLTGTRKETMDQHSWTDLSQYETALSEAIHHDPYLWSKGLKNKRIMAIISSADTFVPSQYQYSFVERTSPQSITMVNTSHSVTLFLAPYTHSKAFADFILNL